MNHTIVKLVEQYAASVKKEEEALLKVLGKIPAPSHHEDQRAEYIRDWMISIGASDVSIDHLKNVICKINCTDNNDLIVFAAHTDVVFPDTTPLPMTKDGRILRAPGIGDDTSNLCNLLFSLKYVLTHPMNSATGFLFVANSCEEGLGNLDGTKELFRVYGNRIKKFYSFDGYTGQCTYIPVGSYRYEISVQVQGGHSYFDFGRPNAISIMSSLIQDLYSVEEPNEALTTYNVGKIEGGTTVNSIAQNCKILYEFRSSSQKCLSIMEEKLHSVINLHQSDDCKIDVNILGIRPGSGNFEENVLEQFTKQSSDIISTFYDGKINYSPASTDSNIPLSMGICANTIGTVIGDLAHTRQEWIDLDSLPTGLKIALSIILQHFDI